jgi:hypothetical protein
MILLFLLFYSAFACNITSIKYLLSNAPVSILPPNPTLPNSTSIFDSSNRTAAFNITLKQQFDTILEPMNSLNQLLTANNPTNTCTQRVLTVFTTWSRSAALTGQTNPYSCLLHRLTTYNAATEYMRLRQTNKQLVTWFNNIQLGIRRWPVPYSNNFYIYEQRALAAISMLQFQSIQNLILQLQQFLQSKFSNNIITTELRGAKTIEYHIYYLNGLLDILYIYKYAIGYKYPNWKQLENVITTLNNTRHYQQILNISITPGNPSAINLVKQRWDCIHYNKNCIVFNNLRIILTNRRKVT